MRNEKKFYVGGGIAKNAFLYALPIVLEYCKIKRINTIILADHLLDITKEKTFKEKITKKIKEKIKTNQKMNHNRI